MIHSMTAFARQEESTAQGNITWEISSINHRYLDVYLRLPENFAKLEPSLREVLRSKLARGKIEITLRYQPQSSAQTQISVNQELALQLINAFKITSELAKKAETSFNPIDILNWPGVVQIPEINFENLESVLLATFNKTLEELLQARSREGDAIQEFLQQKLIDMQVQIAKVKTRLPAILSEQREKILARFAEVNLALDPTRLEQEMVLLAQKIDVSEELNRHETHLLEMKRTIQQNGPSGRRLDFLLQELNREANTLGSKSVSMETTLVAVELKVLIDQMREQVQNIE